MTSTKVASCLVDLLITVDSACFRNLPGARGHTGVGVWTDIRFECSCVWLYCLLNSVFEQEMTVEQVWPREHVYETPGIV